MAWALWDSYVKGTAGIQGYEPSSTSPSHSSRYVRSFALYQPPWSPPHVEVQKTPPRSHFFCQNFSTWSRYEGMSPVCFYHTSIDVLNRILSKNWKTTCSLTFSRSSMMEMNKNSWTLRTGLSSFLTTVCTQLKSFASTIWLMMFDRTKFLLIQQLTTISWFTPLKQVQMCILTGMPMFSGYFTLTSCMLALDLQITHHKIWSSYGFAGLSRYPAII